MVSRGLRACSASQPHPIFSMVPARKFFDEHVGLASKLAQELLAARVSIIQGKASLISIENHDVEAVASNPGRKLTGVVAAPGLFHLDHLGSKITEQHPAIGDRR